MTEYVLEADHVSYRYDRKGPLVLNDVNMRIGKGVKTAILGANGAGKSTLFSVLNALYKPDEGTVLFNGSPVSYRHKNIIKMRSQVSILFQNPNDMLFRPNVEQDVAYGPENMKLPKDEIERRVDDALFAVGMSEFKKSPIMKLSYGQRKRITLAGVLAMEPQVLIMDEPTAGLDPQMAYEVMEIAEQLHRTGVTVIMSSHDTNLTYSWADEIHVMQKGKCVYSGAPEPFYSDKTSVYLSGLLCPSVFLMNQGLSSIGTVDTEPFPRAQTQISAKIAGNKSGKFGTLNILTVGPDADINELIAQHGLEGMSTGLYGLSARSAQHKSKAGIDFVYNGPENCTMKCIAGNDALLICDPVMVESAKASADFINGGGYGNISVNIING
ncbi:cobalt transport protein ATP-binding subunit [Thermoplasmatales archaeon BRNA1]|nr:cobalt transport protein ATP-binding subunit [Thermoplasmatales archaeon BRNA1]